jgi:hypothetical protein
VAIAPGGVAASVVEVAVVVEAADGSVGLGQ